MVAEFEAPAGKTQVMETELNKVPSVVEVNSDQSDDPRVLSPRHQQPKEEQNQQQQKKWVPSCFGFGCADESLTIELALEERKKTVRSHPIIMLKGLSTMTLGKICDKKKELKDDIALWRDKIEDNIYVGAVLYASKPPKWSFELDENFSADKYITVQEGSEAKEMRVEIETVDEYPYKEVQDRLTVENGASLSLLRFLKLLKNRDYPAALQHVVDFLKEQQTLTEDREKENIEYKVMVAFAAHNRAVLELINGLFKYSVYHFKQSADIKEQVFGTEHECVLESLDQLAIGLFALGAYDQCHAVYRTIHTRSHSRILAGRTWNGIGLLWFQKGEHKFAIQCCVRSSQHKENEKAALIALVNKGYMQLATGNVQGRDTLLQVEKALVARFGDDSDIVQSVQFNIKTYKTYA